MSVIVETTVGPFVVDLYIKDAPLECENFLKLCKIKYFQYAPLLNIQRNYTVEVADPMYPISKEGDCIWGLLKQSKHGKYSTNDKHLINDKYSNKFSPKANMLKHDKIGTVSLITNYTTDKKLLASSRLLITLDENLRSLDKPLLVPVPVVFGHIVEGFETLNAINESSLDSAGSPLVDIRIVETYIIDDPFVDLDSGILPLIPKTSKPFPESLFPYIRLPDETALSKRQALLNNTYEEDEEPLVKQQKIRAQEAESQALTLEMIGDLPRADIKPLENILFVCKLNPITQDDDLQLIFARFGQIKSCQIVRDRDTGASLQYAFIEFESKKSCEAAYLKMDGVLIDDRRIHVDFSQSVWNYKHNSQNDRSNRSSSYNGRNAGFHKDNYHGKARGKFYRSNSSENYYNSNRHDSSYKSDKHYNSDRHYKSGNYGSHHHRRRNDSDKSSRDHYHDSRRNDRNVFSQSDKRRKF